MVSHYKGYLIIRQGLNFIVYSNGIQTKPMASEREAINFIDHITRYI